MSASLVGEERHRRLHRARLAYFARRLASTGHHIERELLVREIAFESAALRDITPRDGPKLPNHGHRRELEC